MPLAKPLPGRCRQFGVNIHTGTFVEQVNKEDTLAAADRPWFEAHVRLLARPAFQFSLMLTQNPAIAEEILQDALTQRSEEHTSELQSLAYLVCRLLLEKKKKPQKGQNINTDMPRRTESTQQH